MPPAPSSKPFEKPTNTTLLKQYEEQNAEALKLLATFCEQIEVLVGDNMERLFEDDFRADRCDELIAKYLTNKLDKMEATKTIAKVRKYVGNMIEELSTSPNPARVLNLARVAAADCKKMIEAANGSNIQNNVTDERPAQSTSQKDEHQQPPQEHQPSKDTKTTQARGATATTAAASTSASEKAIALDKEKREKQRIKAQYEELMNLKKKTDNHPDDETAKQHIALHADIQSVIDSINNKPTSKK